MYVDMCIYLIYVPIVRLYYIVAESDLKEEGLLQSGGSA